ncbi:VirB4 family type IV secretion system protein [Alkaliphilus sp. B6464]|uniref:VirB4 family type IV secretion system protein n=1 Tax=Alkaliphilus sp. B6464 TaxID=2731219 RepID=UPI001BA9771A|nr:DUF87 domain-containing protein [Alkaliphilus sp. B6464]QUH20400.1 DUF87 domain-containing protein [Alkaliphilus sp. B6464]
MAKKKEISKVNNSLLNIITPVGLKFRKNTFDLGESTSRAYGIIKYPQSPDYGWLSRITNIPSTIVSIDFTPIDNSTFVNSLSNLIKQQKGVADSTRDPLTASRAEKIALDAEKTMVDIDGDKEIVGLLSTVIVPISRDEQVFEKICRKVESSVSVLKCKLRTMSNLQKEGFKQISPFYVEDEDISNITQRVVPLSTFIGGFPFASSGYNDGTGYYYAKDSGGGLVVIDPWKRGGDRTNSFFVIMGVPGVGKSTVVKHIALSEYMKGTKIIFIDPHREYKELCKNLNGDWINAGGGSKGKINPLQIRIIPKDDDEESDNEKLYVDEGYGMGDMALYIKNLEIFFKLYIPSLTDRFIAILKSELIELYNNFNIFWDTDISKLSNTDFPIILDLYHQVLNKSKDKSLSYQKDYEDLALLLKDMALGSDSFLWNGHTTIQADSKCICIDTKDLQNTSENILSTQYFNLLQWAWEEIIKDPTEKVMLFCDEAYLMIDPRVPQSLIFLRNLIKGARKYEGGGAIISHIVGDFLDPKIKMYGQAILDLPTFKVLMGTDGKNLEETKDLYSLTEAEEELLASKQRGRALFMAGSKRFKINFEIPEYKLRYMGSSGGR